MQKVLDLDYIHWQLSFYTKNLQNLYTYLQYIKSFKLAAS